MNTEPWYRLVLFAVPFDSIDPTDIRVVAETFRAFVKAMGYSSPNDG